MTDFKKIETQEELDGIIKSRLARERESVKKEYEEKYKDYDDFKTQLEAMKGEKTALEEQVNSMNDKVKDYETLSSKNKQLETDKLKVEIALSKGIPYEMAMRLNGDNEDEIKKDAEAMAKYITSKNPMPKKSTEQKLQDIGNEAYRKLVKGLEGE